MAQTATSYSLPQKALHWLMALLIFFNLIFSDGMEHWSRLVRKAQPITDADISSANIHAYVGFAILALAAIRLILRFVQGAPAAPENEPALAKLGSVVAHVALYALFFVMPITGISHYYFGNSALGQLHGGLLKVLLWVIVLGHIGAALVHKFYWKTDVMERMTRG